MMRNVSRPVWRKEIGDVLLCSNAPISYPTSHSVWHPIQLWNIIFSILLNTTRMALIIYMRVELHGLAKSVDQFRQYRHYCTSSLCYRIYLLHLASTARKY